MEFQLDRRQMLLVTGGGLLGAMSPSPARAQKIGPSKVLAALPIQAGQIHRQRLQHTASVLGKATITSEAGLHALVEDLRKSGIISNQEAEILHLVISILFQDLDDESFTTKLSSILDDLVKSGSDVAIALVSIVQDSYAFLREEFAQLDRKKRIAVVASDFVGGLVGAAAGATLGGPWGAVFGAVVGAAGTSAETMFE